MLTRLDRWTTVGRSVDADDPVAKAAVDAASRARPPDDVEFVRRHLRGRVGSRAVTAMFRIGTRGCDALAAEYAAGPGRFDSRDPRARAFLLELAQASPLQAVAIESLGYDVPEGCDALAQLWVEAHTAAPVDPTREGLLLHVFKVTSPACRDALRRVDPEAVQYMPGEATSL